MRRRVQVAVVVPVVTAEIADVSADATVYWTTPVGFTGSTDIQSGVVPVVEIDVGIVDVVDGVGVRVQKAAATTSGRQATRQAQTENHATSHYPSPV